MDIACLPADVQRRILRFLSHPTADLIKQQAKHLHVLYIHDGDQLPLFRSSVTISIASTSPNGYSST